MATTSAWWPSSRRYRRLLFVRSTHVLFGLTCIGLTALLIPRLRQSRWALAAALLLALGSGGGAAWVSATYIGQLSTGAGKTRLMRVICGILEESRGAVSINDLGLTKYREELQSLIGYLPQEFGSYEGMSARQFLDYQAMLKGKWEVDERRHAVETALRAVHLGESADRKIGGFSGGMKQRVGIAQTLLHLPRILVVDEPTAGLDPRERIRFRNLLAELARDRVVIFSTHIIEDISSSCNRLAVLAAGRGQFHGTPRELVELTRGVHAYNVALVFLTSVAVHAYNVEVPPGPKDIYFFLLVPGVLLIFYPSSYAVQADADARMLETLFGIPDYRYKIWLVRHLVQQLIVALLLFLLALFCRYALLDFYLFVGSILTTLLGLLRLQQREKFI